MPPSEYLRKVLRYDPETGKLFWLERTPDTFPEGIQAASLTCAKWNGQFAGKEAFTSVNGSGYLRGKINNLEYRAHRIIWLLNYGVAPDKVDHINGVRTDNRLENLRSVDTTSNARNMRMSSRNTSGVNGVRRVLNRWRAYIYINNKMKHLGSFEKIEDAAEARRRADRDYGFHANHGRKGNGNG